MCSCVIIPLFLDTFSDSSVFFFVILLFLARSCEWDKVADFDVII